MKKLIFTATYLLIASLCYSQTTLYVDEYVTGNDDTKAIAKAFNIAQGATEKVTIKFSSRTYIIDPVKIESSFKDSDILFTVMSNLTIEGGKNTRLVMKKSWTKQFDLQKGNFILFGNRKVIQNLVIQSMIIDFDGTHNNLKTKSGSLNNSFLYLKRCQNVKVSNIHVLNNPGRQSIYIGDGDKKGGYLASNIIVEQCFFSNVADNLAGNSQNDHSSIYIAADSAKINNNIFISGKGLSNVATAIEAHTTNSDFSANRITNYSTGINIVATDGDLVNCSFVENDFNNVKKAFVFWSRPGRKMSKIRIANNRISQAKISQSMVRMSGTLKSYIESLEITGNFFSGKRMPEKNAFANNHAIELGYIKNVIIKGNAFKDVGGRAITMVGRDFSSNKIDISGNTFSNVNAAKNDKYKFMVDLRAIGQITTLRITNNSIDRKDHFYYIGSKILVKTALVKNNNLNSK